jgi:hypothetical protein
VKLQESPFKNPYFGLEYSPKTPAHELKRLSKGYLVTLSKKLEENCEKGNCGKIRGYCGKVYWVTNVEGRLIVLLYKKKKQVECLRGRNK